MPHHTPSVFQTPFGTRPSASILILPSPAGLVKLRGHDQQRQRAADAEQAFCVSADFTLHRGGGSPTQSCTCNQISRHFSTLHQWTGAPSVKRGSVTCTMHVMEALDSRGGSIAPRRAVASPLDLPLECPLRHAVRRRAELETPLDKRKDFRLSLSQWPR
jgi:hypothetical protein